MPTADNPMSTSEVKRPPYKSTGFSQRFDDTALAFSMKAYEHKEYGCEPDVVWMFSVRKYCGGTELIRITATEKALCEMRNFIDRALEMCNPPSPSTSSDEGGR